jgi:hypothetical protein
MTAAEFQQFIKAFAEMLSEAGAIGQANTWRALHLTKLCFQKISVTDHFGFPSPKNPTLE